MQFCQYTWSQSRKTEITESTALGAAYMAGISSGLWSMSDVAEKRNVEMVFNPEFKRKIDDLYNKWQDAVKRSMNSIND